MQRVFGLVFVGVALLAGACGKKQPPEGSSIRPASSVDHFASGEALAKALGDWKARWEREPAPPACEERLVKLVDDRKLCSETAAALARLQERVKAGAPAPEVLNAASELSLTGSRAEKRLRMLAMEYLATQGASAAASGSASAAASGSAVPPPSAAPPPSAHAMLRSLSALRESGAAGHGVVGRDNPYQPLVRGYSKLSAQALRFLGAYVETAPLPLRTAAVAELERLHADHQPWHQLAQVARQAALLERTPELKQRLGKLDPLRGATRRPRISK